MREWLGRPPIWIGSGCWCDRSRTTCRNTAMAGFGSADLDTGKAGAA